MVPPDSRGLCSGRPIAYVIRLSGPAVIGDCYGPGDEAGDDAGEEQSGGVAAELLDRAAMVLEGPERRPVSWRVSAGISPIR